MIPGNRWDTFGGGGDKAEFLHKNIGKKNLIISSTQQNISTCTDELYDSCILHIIFLYIVYQHSNVLNQSAPSVNCKRFLKLKINIPVRTFFVSLSNNKKCDDPCHSCHHKGINNTNDNSTVWFDRAIGLLCVRCINGFLFFRIIRYVFIKSKKNSAYV